MSIDDLNSMLKELPRIAKAVNQFASEGVQRAAFDALMASLDPNYEKATEHTQVVGVVPKERTPRARPKSAKRASPTKKRNRNSSPSLVKALDLRPKGEKSFRDFVEEKQPNNQAEKCVVCVYYLRRFASCSAVSPDHVYTCFKDAGWPVPKDIANTLHWTASQNAWLDTADTQNISVAVSGENFIEHELPHKTPAKSAKKK